MPTTSTFSPGSTPTIAIPASSSTAPSTARRSTSSPSSRPLPPTEPAVTSINDGTFHSGNGNVVTGVNMRFADEFPGNHLVIRDSNGEDIQAMISTDDDVPRSETSFGLIIDHSDPLAVGDEYTFEFEMLDEGGLPVTVTKTARWQE